MLDTFLQTFPPSPSNALWTDAQCAQYCDIVPPEVMELWQKHGLGSYAGGLFQVVDPQRYEEGIYPYIFRDERKRYVPLILTAFGNLYFARQLNNPATPDFTHDIQFLNVHTGGVGHVTFDVGAFFNTHLASANALENELQKGDFERALAAGIPLPGPDQMLCYTPALAMGGDGDPTMCTLGDARVHWDILRQMRG